MPSPVRPVGSTTFDNETIGFVHQGVLGVIPGAFVGPYVLDGGTASSTYFGLTADGGSSSSTFPFYAVIDGGGASG